MSLNIIHFPNLIKNLPLEVQKLFDIFLNKGDEIKLVGGCVRDLLIKKQVNDFDFATKFLPEEIIKILEKHKIQAIPTGIKFGTITAVVNHKNFEITTLRKDSETDGRHCQPEFVDDYFLDAARRDFTINALYLDSKGFVHDYFNGISDLKNQKVRFIGNSQERIEEDFLRILRFFRFSCDYAENLDEEGLKACFEKKNGLKKLSCERIRMEFLKLISSPKKAVLIEILKQAKEQKILSEIFSIEPDIKALETLFQITNKLQISVDLNLKIAALFLNFSSAKNFKKFDIQNEEKTSISEFYKEISITNFEKKYLEFLLFNFSKISVNISLDELKILLAFNDKNLIQDLYLLTLIKDVEDFEIKIIQEKIDFLKDFSLPNFPLNGDDLKEIGLENKQIGLALKRAKTFWAKQNFKANKSDLIKFLKIS